MSFTKRAFTKSEFPQNRISDLSKGVMGTGQFFQGLDTAVRNKGAATTDHAVKYGGATGLGPVR